MVAIIAVLAVWGHKNFYTVLPIKTPSKTIWKALMDTALYSRWNHFIPKVEGNYAQGESITNHTMMPSHAKAAVMKTRVAAFEAERLLHQHGAVPFFITFDHHDRLKPQKDGATLLIQEERWRRSIAK